MANKEYELTTEYLEKTFAIEKTWYSTEEWAFYFDLWDEAQKKLLELLDRYVYRIDSQTPGCSDYGEIMIAMKPSEWQSLLAEFGIGESNE